MPTTPEFDLPYPSPSDTPDVPYWLQQLAEAAETHLPKITSGYATVHLAAASSGFVSIDVSAAGFTAVPAIAAISTNFSYYCYRAAGGTNDANTITIGVRQYANANATADVTFSWIATGV